MVATTSGAWRTRGLLLAAAGALMLSGCSPRSVYTDGYTAYYEGDYRTAMAEFAALARQGDEHARFVLSQMCGYRQEASSLYGVPPGRVVEQKWYRDICQQTAGQARQPGVLYF